MVEVVGLDPDHEMWPVGRVNFRETRHVTDFVSSRRARHSVQDTLAP